MQKKKAIQLEESKNITIAVQDQTSVDRFSQSSYASKLKGNHKLINAKFLKNIIRIFQEIPTRVLLFKGFPTNPPRQLFP